MVTSITKETILALMVARFSFFLWSLEFCAYCGHIGCYGYIFTVAILFTNVFMVIIVNFDNMITFTLVTNALRVIKVAFFTEVTNIYWLVWWREHSELFCYADIAYLVYSVAIPITGDIFSGILMYWLYINYQLDAVIIIYS